MLPRHYWFIILTYVLMHLSGFVAVPFIVLQFKKDPYIALAYWNIIAFSIAIMIIVSMLQKHKEKDIRENRATPNEVIAWSVLGIFLAFGAQIVAGLIELNLLGIDPGSENTEQIMDITRIAPAFVVIPAILAPILEEIVFRKVIFGSLYKKMNFFFAAVISSIIFGVIHLDLTHLLVYTSMGFVFAFLYVKTKRIIVPIIVHMGMNTITVLAQLMIDPEMIEQMQRELALIFFGG